MNKEYLRMQKLAGVITEGQYKEYLLILEDDTLEEGLKNWLIAGLIALTTLGGIGKVVQMDQQAEKDNKARIEYYQKVVEPELKKYSEDDLVKLGAEIGQANKEIQFTSDQMNKMSNDEIYSIYKGYAEKYIKNHPQEFSVGVNGGIYWTK